MFQKSLIGLIFLVLGLGVQAALAENHLCSMVMIPVVAELNEMLPEGVEHIVSYRTPRCKTVAVGFSKKRPVMVVARFTGFQRDLEFSSKGWREFPFFSSAKIMGDLSHLRTKKKFLLAGAVRIGIPERLGFFLAQFSPEGDFEQRNYQNGFAFDEPAPWVRRCSGAQLNLERLNVQKNVAILDGELATGCSGHQIRVITNVGLVKPVLEDQDLPVPGKCDDDNFRSSRFFESEDFSFKQSGCEQIDFHYYRAGNGSAQPARSEDLTIYTDGTCFDSKSFGRSCFGFEKGTLIRQTITPTWMKAKSYFKVINANGQICGLKGFHGPTLVESPLAPPNPEFTRLCRAY